MILPPLAAIRAFEAVARHQSFTLAASELGVSQAAVSYQIKLLEEKLATPLFQRGARGITLTEAGQRLAPQVTKAFNALFAAFSEFNGKQGGVLSIAVVPTFASNWLVNRIGSFQKSYPRIAVRLDVSGRPIDLGQGEFDLAIRVGNGNWQGLAAHHLIPIKFTPLVSPRLLEQFRLSEPRDLLSLPLIEPSDPWWAEWFNAVGVSNADFTRQADIKLSVQHLAGSAAISGQGAAILTPAFFENEIADGRLVQPFPYVHGGDESYWLTYLETRRRAPNIRAFRDWVLTEIAT